MLSFSAAGSLAEYLARVHHRGAVPVHRGASDCCIYQFPGSLERMQETACARMRGVHLIEGPGHRVQQEQPEWASELLLGFLKLDDVT